MKNTVSNSANSAGKVRPGQRKPYVKATRQQIDERRGYVARLLRAGKTKTQIHHAVREKFGVEWRQCDRAIAWLAKSDAPDT
jgi:hypothetical protein